MISKQKSELLRRRKIAAIVTAAIIVLLIPVIVFTVYWSKTEPFYDIDDTKYLIRNKGGEFALYDTDGNKMATDGQYGYYVTALGTLVEIDEKTGKYEIIAVVETEGNEELGHNQRILMFPKVSKDELRTLEVVNSHGSFTFERFNVETGMVDNTSDFIIKGAPFAAYSQDLFASLYVDAGYTITTRKIKDPIKDENGEFTEYGLVEEKRVDDEGNEYDYVPAYYVLTDINGNKHKVIIGDKLVTGGGYYVQYVYMDGTTETKRDAVYVFRTEIENTMLAAIEDFATPTIVYPMTMNTYLDVENFVLAKKDPAQEHGYNSIVKFSFIDLALRENTIKANFPYVFDSKEYEGYIPNADNIGDALSCLYQTDFVGVTSLMPTDQELVDHGLAKFVTDKDGKQTIEFESEYMISFKYDIVDKETNEKDTIREIVLVSKKNESGNYYAYGIVCDAEGDENDFLYTFDMIVEVAGHSLDFVTWDSYKWITDKFVYLNIAYCESIVIESPNYNASFDLDNSKSDQSKKTSSDKLEVIGSDSKGNTVHTFSGLTVKDKAGNTWEITPSEITAKNAQGVKLKITSAYYAHNSMGSQVRVIKGHIDCDDGSEVEVSADTVTVTANGEKTVYIRYATNLFRQFFQTLITSNIENSYALTEEEENALVNDESKWLLTVTVKDSEGKTTVCKFYSLTSRKAYITINGTGGFYVLSGRVEKIIADAQRFYNLELIYPEAKN